MRSVVDRNVVMRRMTVRVYEYETWSVTLRERYKLRIFKERVLRGYLDIGERK